MMDSYNKITNISNKTIKDAAVEIQEQSMPDAGKLEYELATRTEDTILRDIVVRWNLDDSWPLINCGEWLQW